MNGLIWGLISSFGYGTADFIARFTSRAIGATVVVFGVFLTGSILLTAYILFSGLGFNFSSNNIWLLPLAGVANMLMLVFLFEALARGPIAVAAPIVSSHPGLVLIMLAFLGVIPSLLEIVGLVIIISGVIFLSKQTSHITANLKMDHAYIYKTILIASAASVAYAIQVIAAQEAAIEFGPFLAAWATRTFGLIAIVILLLCQKKRVVIPIRWWPIVIVQGCLDVAAVLALILGSLGQDRIIVAILSSTFSVVTVLLARVFIKEPVSRNQWLAIFIIVIGVAIISAESYSH